MFTWSTRALGQEEDDDDDIVMGDVPEETPELPEEQVAEEKKTSLSDQKLQEERTNMIIAHFLFSLVWSIGGTLDGPSRLKFDDFFRALCEEGGSVKVPK